jgi:formate-dependent nitrite reductase membrane component NrfD
MVPEAEFSSYYGRPVLKEPVWEAADIGSYLFLGGLAGSSSALAAGAQFTGRPSLARAAKLGASGAASLALGALIHDLGRPARFLNMLRVFKPSSPMSVGSWLLAVYDPVASTASLCEATGRLPRIGAAATAGAAALGPALTGYTAALLADTAVPAWHEARAELPYLFISSGAIAAAGFGLVAAPVNEQAPARRLAVLGAGGRFLATQSMNRRLGIVAETYKSGRAGALLRAAQVLRWTGLAGAFAARRSRIGAAASGAALLASAACTRFGVFEAGRASARDPKYTVVPQRERANRARQERGNLAGQAGGQPA